MRRLILAKLQNDLRQVRLVRPHARRLKKRIQLDLRRSHRLDLDDFVDAFSSRSKFKMICRASAASAAQCTTPPAAVHRSSNCSR